MATSSKAATGISSKVSVRSIRERMIYHLTYTRCKDWRSATDCDKEVSFALAIRELAMDRMIATQRAYVDHDVKRLYYLSMEFLLGRLLENNIAALGITDAARAALKELEIDFDGLLRQEPDAGLGNGGLGRLAACFLDSLASSSTPATATACGTNTACSARNSKTAGRRSARMTGSNMAMPGK